ncbi:hypothetical protein [Aquimarina sp. MMG016]|uniref:hypothetical protein n=1 Tax=Aquimarina sp. MMG016 TaxID=2822690 RepID=UPI001B39D6BE|nr:hypothetical protein [Aquimarina sp. MMG016]MBQ4821141.1 hypothetical protein [Aquimarina sp. MMG016]
MKPTSRLLLPLLFCYTFCLSQSKKEILIDISNKYQVIRELLDSDALRQHHTNYVCEESSDNGSLTFYYNSSELKHILHIYTLGHVIYKDEYYIWDDQLFFQFATHKVKYKDYKRNKYGKLTQIKVTLNLEERFYFHNNEIIKCQFKDFETRSSNRKNPKTNYVRNQTVSCDQADKVMLKFNTLLQNQELNLTNNCLLPRSISKILSDDVIYSNLGINHKN